MTRPIEPLRPTAAPGRYEDDLVVVRRGFDVPGGVRTEHFSVAEQHGRLHVGHRVPAERLDDDLTGLLADELFAPGWVVGSSTFERIFAGTVLTSGPDPLSSWELFYRNTLGRLAAGPRGSGSMAAYAPVYEHALTLVEPGATLDLGSCFGFLPLMLAARGTGEVIASDVAAGTAGLLAAVSERLGTPLRTLAADAARVPLPSAGADTVTAIHLLEHLDQEHGAAVVAEALRLARRRVVIAVPFEAECTTAYGHVRTFGAPDLRTMGEASGVSWRIEEHHGGWLVLEK